MKQLQSGSADKSVKPVVTIGSELAKRLSLSFDRMEGPEYLPAQVYASTENNSQWPGDFAGRTILALAHLSRVTRRVPKHLEALLEELPSRLNSQGYLGEAYSGSGAPLFDEQQLSGHGWLVSGLMAAADLTGDLSWKHLAIRITTNLFLPLRGHLASYPTRPDARGRTGNASGERIGQCRKWQLSSDIGCVFIAMEGLVAVYESTLESQYLALIEEMADAFANIDLIKASMQLHASLTAARQFLRCHDSVERPALLEAARQVYAQFRTHGMTENYANFNWFDRPASWTEPCAIVDALICAIELWRKTGDASYLEDAHSIYYNALGYAQKPHGGFGLENCVGPEDDWLRNTTYDVTWCCNMRGAVGLATLVDAACLQSENALTFTFYFDSSVRAEFPEGRVDLKLTTEYPYRGLVHLQVEASTVSLPKTLRFFLPGWADANRVELRLNGAAIPLSNTAGFCVLTWLPTAGDKIDFSFPCGLRAEPALSALTRSGRYSLRHGPLMLGSAASTGVPDLGVLPDLGAGVYHNPASGENLTPLNNMLMLTEGTARRDCRRVLFEEPA